jgi:DNA replication protein DnaC
MYSRENYIKAKEEIENRRKGAIATAESRNLELREKYESIRAIDAELSGTGLKLFKLACSGGDIAPLKARNELLVKERRALLVSLGYPEDYTDLKYTCEKCSDTGFAGTKMCACLRELLLRKNIMSSGIGKLIDKQSFDNFDLEWYRDKEENYKNMSRNLKTAKNYAATFGSRPRNLFLIGSTGCGKTHLSTAIAAEVISRGFDVLYDSAQNIISAYENDRFRAGYGQRELESAKYTECELLIIDDLGTEFVNQFTISTLYNLINTRQNKGLSTIISTNLSFEELGAKYEGRIYSRIVGCDYEVLFFGGRDHRIFV